MNNHPANQTAQVVPGQPGAPAEEPSHPINQNQPAQPERGIVIPREAIFHDTAVVKSDIMHQTNAWQKRSRGIPVPDPHTQEFAYHPSVYSRISVPNRHNYIRDPRFYSGQTLVPRFLTAENDPPLFSPALATLAHTRGLLARPCWRENMYHSTRAFQETVLLFDVVGGSFLVDCCTNCFYVGSTVTRQRRCTAIPFDSDMIVLPRLPDPTTFTDGPERFHGDKEGGRTMHYCRTMYFPSVGAMARWVPALSHDPARDGRKAQDKSMMYLIAKYDLQPTKYKEFQYTRGRQPAYEAARVQWAFSSSQKQSEEVSEILQTAEKLDELYQIFTSVGENYKASLPNIKPPAKIDCVIEETCYVCLGEYNDRKHVPVRNAGCRHVIGLDCYKDWSSSQLTMDVVPTCSTCRTETIAAVPILSDPTDFLKTKMQITKYYEVFTELTAIRQSLHQMIEKRNPRNQTRSYVAMKGCQVQAEGFLTILENFWLAESREEHNEWVKNARYLAELTNAEMQNFNWPDLPPVVVKALYISDPFGAMNATNTEMPKNWPDVLPVVDLASSVSNPFEAMSKLLGIFRVQECIVLQGLIDYPTVKQKPINSIWSVWSNDRLKENIKPLSSTYPETKPNESLPVLGERRSPATVIWDRPTEWMLL